MRALLCAVAGLILFGSLAHGQEVVKIEIREAWEHQIGSRRVIHSKENLANSGREEVQVEVIVDADGNVESAKAIGGAAEFFDPAEGLEFKRKFRPFLREGNPVRVSFLDYVQIMPPEEWAGTNISFPKIKDQRSLKMQLERTGCFGSCPAYSVEVKGDGSVEFTGTFQTLVMGHHRGQISKQAVGALLADFRRANYFSLKDSYAFQVTDSPTYKTSIEFDGNKKSVRDYVGLQVGMPEAARDVEEAIDRIAGTKKWIDGNEETVRALMAEKWDFKADSDENRILFANAIDHGPPDLIQLFIDSGAPAISMTKEGQGALVNAAGKGNLELVKRLLANQADTPSTVLSCALGAGARSGNLELTRFLLEKGAGTNGPACGKYEKKTVLMNAVASGKAEIVEEILWHDPEVDSTSGPSGFTALAYFLLEAHEHINTEKIVQLLISAGANVNTHDAQGHTPIFYACENQHGEAVRLLAAAGADLNLKDNNGQTALMSCFGNSGVKALVDAGADLAIENPQGQTAAAVARQMGAADKAELLEAAMKQRKAR